MYRLHSMFLALLLLAGCSALGLNPDGQKAAEPADTKTQTFEAERQALFDQPFIDPLTDYLIEHGSDPDRQQSLAVIRQERDRRCEAVAEEYADQPATPANLRQFNAGYAYSCPQQVAEFEARVDSQPEPDVAPTPPSSASPSSNDVTSDEEPVVDTVSDEARSNCYLLTTIRNFSAAREACQTPAENGDVRAQANLARVAHAFKDYETALKWATQAAPESADAAFLLGQMYANGRGVRQDRQQAAHWYSEAAKLGSEDAKAELERLPDDIHEDVANGES